MVRARSGALRYRSKRRTGEPARSAAAGGFARRQNHPAQGLQEPAADGDSDHGRPTEADATLQAEIPAFLHRLVSFQIPEQLRSERFGVTHFHHPELLTALSEMSPEVRLLSLIDAEREASGELGEWIGTAIELEQMLLETRSAHEARRLLDWNNATGTYLGRLAKKFPERVTQVRTNKAVAGGSDLPNGRL